MNNINKWKKIIIFYVKWISELLSSFLKFQKPQQQQKLYRWSVWSTTQSTIHSISMVWHSHFGSVQCSYVALMKRFRCKNIKKDEKQTQKRKMLAIVWSNEVYKHEQFVCRLNLISYGRNAAHCTYYNLFQINRLPQGKHINND